MNQTKLLQQRNEIVKNRGKGTVITGGSTGIGLATAKRFTSEGAQFLCVFSINSIQHN